MDSRGTIDERHAALTRFQRCAWLDQGEKKTKNLSGWNHVTAGPTIDLDRVHLRVRHDLWERQARNKILGGKKKENKKETTVQSE